MCDGMKIQEPIIGLMDNRWRQRRVTVHNDPDDQEKVITVGAPYDGSEMVVCRESRAAWVHVINVYPRIFVYI